MLRVPQLYTMAGILQDLKLSDDKGIVVLQSLNVSHLFVIPTIFYGFKSLKIACVNYAHFPKSGHIWLILCLYCFHELLAQLLNTLAVY